ncbi:lipocalin family protein [Hymenobacter elongatus]|uniref:Lipocalin-like domain-containing protein n=1 Tax=Hymenobacter elongatus TaxID=877208 RepID=A0A4Z0PJ55_9BACT|nr:lipocalin family protein [Hymenobacter elongatus]TGE15259.1 hypothetical protein E5J99_12835 [Hymenobacter elongatus]
MKYLGLLLLLSVGLFGLCGKEPPALAVSRLLVGKDWVWVSWTEKTGAQASRERIDACRKDDVIRFEHSHGQQLYTESKGTLSCGQPSGSAQGKWQLAKDGRTVTIIGEGAAFDDTWQIDELTETRLQLAYRVATSSGAFVMKMTFQKR